MLNQQDLKELKKLTQQDGLSLSDADLLDMGTQLLNLIETTYKPIKKEWLKSLKIEDLAKN